MSRFRRWFTMVVVFTGIHAAIARATAATITFVEAPNEGPTMTIVDLTGCPGCVLVAATGGAEQGVASFTAPAGFFAGLPTGLTMAQTIVVEPPGVPGEPAGAISDRVFLEINNTSALISVLANFLSDTDNVIEFPPVGFPTVTALTGGGIQNISGNFATQTAPGVFTPFALPTNLVLQIQDVPEPSTGLLLIAGLLRFSWMRYRSRNSVARC